MRLPLDVEQQVDRILKQGPENAYQQANASRIFAGGTITPGPLDLFVEDDGKGIPVENPDLPDLQYHRHFGLVGMVERAELIHVVLRFEAKPVVGTRITIHWNPVQQAGEPYPANAYLEMSIDNEPNI